MRALVTGINGFAGRHLARHLFHCGDEVVGLIKPGTDRPEGIACFEADVTDGEAVGRGIAVARPDAIYHLAALSHVGESWQRRRPTFEVNVLGALAVLDAARRIEPKPRVLLVGSSEQYGRPASEKPIAETEPLRPVSPYGASKAAQELLGLQAWLGDGVPVVLVRAFNHAGPGQEPTFVVSEWARAVAEMELGLRPLRLEVGDVAVERDFSDVRDIVRLYRLLAVSGRPGESYNAGSGVGRPLVDVLEALRGMARVSFVVVPRADRRPAEVRSIVASADKVRRELGWAPEIPFERTLADALEDWRERLACRP